MLFIMEKVKMIYQDTGFKRKIEISIDQYSAYYTSKNMWEQTMLQVPIDKLGRNISYSRSYHIGPIVASSFLLVMSGSLVARRLAAGGWTLYLGLGLILFIGLGYVYYFLYGKQYVQVDLQFGGTTLYLYMTEKKYWALKEVLDNI